MYKETFRRYVKPDPEIDLVEWANRYFYLSKEAAAEYGPYRSGRTPFVEEPLRCLSPCNEETDVVVVVKPTQCGGTTLGLIFMCGIVDLSPGPLLLMMPTDSMARSFSKKKLATCLKHIPKIADKISPPKSRDSANTILQKDFEGGSWTLSGSNSSASYRSESIRYLILDDFDGFEIDIEGEGSPEELADRRTGAFANRKIYINSTTTIKDFSNIERSWARSSMGKWHVPCPHCGHYQYLIWGGEDVDYGIKFRTSEDGTVTDVWYICECCRRRIENADIQWMNENGAYIHKYPERRIKGFRWNALYTPIGWVNNWRYIAQKFIEATKELKEGKPEKYKTWLNSFMAEPYEDPGEAVLWSDLYARREQYKYFEVPVSGLILTAGVDTQDDRLAVVIRAWGRGEESWLVYWGELYGDPVYPDVWEQLDKLLNQSYRHEAQTALHITAMGIDSGGHRTQAVYNYCRQRAERGVFALFGASQPGKPALSRPSLQDVDWKGQKLVKGVHLWPVGVDYIKSVIMARLRIENPGPGYLHFPAETPEEYFKQLTGEKLVTYYKGGVHKKRWVQTRKRVEALDCEVYAYAAAVKAGINRITEDGWDQLEASVCGSRPEAKAGRRESVAASGQNSRPRVIVKSNFLNR